MMDRRQFLRLAALASVYGQGDSRAGAMPSAEEPFPVLASDVDLVPPRYRRQMVPHAGKEQPGTIIVDTGNRFLYLVRPGKQAIRYGIGVGRQGFSWWGRAEMRWKAKWPRWTPPAEMVARDPFAAKWADGMPGGPNNPLGARALYLFQGNVDTLYRIHGTNDPRSIGKAVSSGCIRLLNIDIIDLYERVTPGARVVVLRRGTSPQISRVRMPGSITPPSKPVVRRNFNLD
jgi:lipoprotein-anchoring transpeptidase ErfK/SrfK